MITMLKTPATVGCLRALGPNCFIPEFLVTENGLVVSMILTREQLAILGRLIPEALRATQDQVQDPALLAAVVVS